MLAQAKELHHQGDEFADKASLTEAINVYRDAVLLAPRGHRLVDWAITQNNNLREALATLG